MRTKMGYKRMKRLLERVNPKALIGRDIEISGDFLNFPTLNYAKCKIIDINGKEFCVKVYHLSNTEEDFIFLVSENEICYIYPNFINESYSVHSEKIQKIKNLRKKLIKINKEIYNATKDREELINDINKMKKEKEN